MQYMIFKNLAELHGLKCKWVFAHLSQGRQHVRLSYGTYAVVLVILWGSRAECFGHTNGDVMNRYSGEVPLFKP